MDEYQITCDCGSKVRVHVGQCGLEVLCQDCRKPVKVPDLIALKQMSGDPYPHLTAFDKIARTAQDGEAPFDGVCHRCQSAAASVIFPVSLVVLEERDLESHGGYHVAPLVIGRFQKKLAAGTEYWRKVDFPLLLCAPCASAYGKARQSRKMTQLFGILTCVVAVLLVTWWIAADVAVVVIVGIALLVSLLVIVGRRQDEARQAAPVDLEWLNSIRWVEEVLRSEDEYRVVVRQARSLESVDAAI